MVDCPFYRYTSLYVCCPDEDTQYGTSAVGERAGPSGDTAATWPSFGDIRHRNFGVKRPWDLSTMAVQPFADHSESMARYFR